MNDSVFRGLPVHRLAPGSPAELAGVLAGDVVVFANGQRINTFPEYCEARKLNPTALELTVLRGAKMIEFKVAL